MRVPEQISAAERTTFELWAGATLETVALTLQPTRGQFARNQSRSDSDRYSVPLISAQSVRSGPIPAAPSNVSSLTWLVDGGRSVPVFPLLERKLTATSSELATSRERIRGRHTLCFPL